MARKKQVARKATGGAQGRKQIAAKRRLAMKRKRSDANCSTSKTVQLVGPSIVMTPSDRAKLTNRIHVDGPVLHPDQDPRSRQRQELRTYFSQFGKIVDVRVSRRFVITTVTFDNCDSAAKCIQQGTHNIQDQDFRVRKSKPSKAMKKKFRENLRQNMPGPSSENMSAANVQSNHPAAESNLGNESPQSTASSSSEGSVIYCETISKEWAQCRGLASFDKSGPASIENVSAASVQSNSPAESNLGNQSPQATASSSSQVQGSIIDNSTLSKKCPQSRELASFDKPGYK